MGHADAALAALAGELDARAVITTDRRGFALHRIPGKPRFRILPE